MRSLLCNPCFWEPVCKEFQILHQNKRDCSPVRIDTHILFKITFTSQAWELTFTRMNYRGLRKTGTLDYLIRGVLFLFTFTKQVKVIIKDIEI